MIIDEQKTLKLFKNFKKTKNSRWEFGNNILYKMVSDNPSHGNADIIVGKILLIGRTYAAAIERRKDASNTNDNFYYDVVAPKMRKIGKELDRKIRELSNSSDQEGYELLLKVHKFLTDAFEKMTHLNKRSLASKYLHFHCPGKVFIYDSRADHAIKKLVHYPSINWIKDADLKLDKVYGDFVFRIKELKEFLETNLKIKLTPREIDTFLLSVKI